MDPLLPLSPVLERSLLPPVLDRYRLSCRALVRTVKETLQLERHLAAVRRVFLMEAGDLLFEFYTDLFGRMQAGCNEEDEDDPLDTAASITLMLQDCIGKRYPGEADRFAICVASEEDEENVTLSRRNADDWLDQAVLTYEVDWPLNIVLNSENLAKYNEVFVFLLR